MGTASMAGAVPAAGMEAWGRVHAPTLLSGKVSPGPSSAGSSPWGLQVNARRHCWPGDGRPRAPEFESRRLDCAVVPPFLSLSFCDTFL